MEDAFSIIVIALAAFALPLVARRLRVPAVVLEIFFGILLGPSVLNLIHSSEIMRYLAELGFLLLMFLSGFEIDFGKLQRQGVAQLSTGLLVFGLTLALAWVAASQLGHGPFVMLLLATTSVGLVVPTLRATRQVATSLGQATLMCALLADFLTLIGVTVLATIHEHGVGWSLLDFPLLFVAITVLVLGVKRYAWWYPEKFERLFEAEDPEELGIRTSLAFMFVVVGISYLLGIEPILGAFLAGTAFALIFRKRGQLEQKLSGFSYGFLIPIFFINIGMEFDLRALMDPAVLAGSMKLLAAAIAVKLLAAFALAVKRMPPREILAAGVLLSARLSLVIAVADLGTRLGLLPREVESQVILIAVVTSTVAPALFRAIVSRTETGSVPDAAPDMPASGMLAHSTGRRNR